MSDQTEIEAKYQAEVKQADLDHHKPTAGAMSGHIVANLWYFDVKLHQALWYVKGEQALQLQDFYTELIENNRQQLDELGAVLLDENEMPPSTVAEYTTYTKLAEDPRIKYEDASEIVLETAHDFTTANMFIDRAIILAQREHRPALAANLTDMRGYNNRQTRKLQALLGKTAWQDLVEVDDDEDDDD
ncbi:ferritin-like domain-containing protein [Lapidilactobacillus mulanensis]|uniref:Ferritin-like domain-containing protein n=1 Tax=Lapidilactobacillus mulanensis TaxID=2485999 RepID=A0ABW4DS42_9LACO|nr:ferritin-like domain-containing protein [Lapidilactobacillus mulanensis]